jgi:hypothetical protein
MFILAACTFADAHPTQYTNTFAFTKAFTHNTHYKTPMLCGILWHGGEVKQIGNVQVRVLPLQMFRARLCCAFLWDQRLWNSILDAAV